MGLCQLSHPARGHSILRALHSRGQWAVCKAPQPRAVQQRRPGQRGSCRVGRCWVGLWGIPRGQQKTQVSGRNPAPRAAQAGVRGRSTVQSAAWDRKLLPTDHRQDGSPRSLVTILAAAWSRTSRGSQGAAWP